MFEIEANFQIPALDSLNLEQPDRHAPSDGADGANW
jgi:hypothetical protein